MAVPSRGPAPLTSDGTDPTDMEDLLLALEDDLLTAVQSVIELLVGLIR